MERRGFLASLAVLGVAPSALGRALATLRPAAAVPGALAYEETPLGLIDLAVSAPYQPTSTLSSAYRKMQGRLLQGFRETSPEWDLFEAIDA